MIYLVNLLIWIYIVGLNNFFAGTSFLIDFIILSVFFFSVYVQNNIPTRFQVLINNNKSIFKSEKSYENFIEYAREVFNSNSEKYIPIILGFLYAIGTVFLSIIENYQYAYVGDIAVELGGINRILFIINNFVAAYTFLTIVTIGISTIFVEIFTFKCLNQLGTEKFPLNVSYKELKIGAFETIGKFIISLTIPTILLSTIISIIGYFYYIFFNQILLGFIFMGVGLFISILLTTLLYKNTIHIHQSIVKFKDDLKNTIISEIQNQINRDSIDYDKIQNIHNFYNEVIDINDWPFNPTSIRKLSITLGSSVLPLILSFFGLA